jgi:hypothetical protein
MNIDNLTIGQAKELANLFSINKEKNSSNLFKDWIGKFAIVRSKNDGVNAGLIVDADETGVMLQSARRLYYHRPANKNTSWYEGVAQTGLSSDSKVGEICNKLIVEDYSLTLCTEAAKESILNAKTNPQ